MSAVLVLCYHALSPDWDAALSTTPERFAAQLEHLGRRGWRGVTFTDAVERAPRRGKVVAVTFDDAFASTELAAPVLERLGWPGTVFVPTAFPAERRPLAWEGTSQWLDGPHAHELRPLGWDGLRGLAARGWEVGAHTVTHPHLTRVDDAQLARELEESRAVCAAELGGCASIAYPYGDVDARVVRAAARAGYRTGAGLPVRPHAPAPLEWPRVGVYHRDDVRRLRLKASRVVRRVRATARPGASSAAAP